METFRKTRVRFSYDPVYFVQPGDVRLVGIGGPSMGKRTNIPGFACPSCRSGRVRKFHRRGYWERGVLRMFWLRPFQCIDCYRRFYGFSFAFGVQHYQPRLNADLAKPPQANGSAAAASAPGVYEERRGFTRLACRIPVRVMTGSAASLAGLVSGISLNGCFVEITDTVSVGSDIELSLEIRGGADARAVVKRSLRARGIGVEFTHLIVPNFQRLQAIARESLQLQVRG